MEQYTEMRNSGVPWIQSIPKNWGVRVLFQLADQVKNKNKDLVEKNLLSLSYGKIKRKDINNPEGLLPESFDGYNIIETNDIVLRLTDLQNDHTSLRVGQSVERGIITSAYTTLRPSALVNPQYLYYVLHAYDLIKGFYGMGAGVRQGLNYDEVKTIKLPFPSLQEQTSIVAYLDDHVSQIDSIITEAQASIEEYRQWKASVIFEAVTKGLNPDVPMKESGIQWIGRIPSLWTCCQMKRVITLINGRAYKDTEFEEDGKYRVLRVGNLFTNSKWYTSSLELEADKYCENGDLLYAWSASYGPYIWDGEKVIYHYHIWKTKLDDKIYKKFAYYYLLALSRNIASESHGSAMAHVTMERMNNSYIAFPLYEEQQRIANYLDQTVDTIDALIAEKENLLIDLEAYKRSLIYEAVTGKRKVV